MIAAKLDIVSDAKIQENGIMALKESLGVTGMLKFLEQFDRGGQGNYTEETYWVDSEDPADQESRKVFGFELLSSSPCFCWQTVWILIVLLFLYFTHC